LTTRACWAIVNNRGEGHMGNVKTNAMRILDRAGVKYEQYSYKLEGEFTDGLETVKKIGQPAEKVYKTLVAQGASRAYYVFVIPVAEELDLKAAAKAVNEKSVEMIRVADINKVTGYIRGGCSPIGMKKDYRTVVDGSCKSLESMIISAGRIGLQIELAPEDLIKIIGCGTADIIHHV